MGDGMESFLVDYDDATEDVTNSKHISFLDNLQQWFTIMDENPEAKAVLHSLESSVVFSEWLRSARAAKESDSDNGELPWPKPRRQRLAMRVGLFRVFAKEEADPLDFNTQFFNSNNNFDAMIGDIVDQLFIPTARDLRKELDNANTSRVQSGDVPASDRVVTLDHNSPDYTNINKALEDAEVAITQSNSFPDPVEKEQLVAEVSAGRRLLRASQVRLQAFMQTAWWALAKVASIARDKVVESIVTGALAALAAYFGITWFS